MTKRNIILGLCMVASVSPVLSAPAVSASDPRTEIALAYRQMDTAASRRDAAGRMAFCDAGFALFPLRGRPVGFAETEQKSARGYSVLRNAQVVTVLQNASTFSDGVEVMAQEHTTAVLMTPSKLTDSRLAVDRTVRDFWVKTPGGWRMRRRRLLATAATVNGKPIRSNLPLSAKAVSPQPPAAQAISAPPPAAP